MYVLNENQETSAVLGINKGCFGNKKDKQFMPYLVVMVVK